MHISKGKNIGYSPFPTIVRSLLPVGCLVKVECLLMVISVISQRPVYLSRLSWSYFYQYFELYSFKGIYCFPKLTSFKVPIAAN